MPPFATLYTTTKFLHAKVTKTLAAAALNHLEIKVDTDFNYPVTNKTTEYLAKFPHGKIPAIETPSGFCLSEAGAIAHYVAESGPARDQLLGRNPEERALVQMWISLADTDIFPNGIIIMQSKYPAETECMAKDSFLRALERVEQHLSQEGKVWIVRNDEFSLADLSIAASLYWPLERILDEEYRNEFPKIMDWWNRLMRVDEVAQAYQAPIQFCHVSSMR
ncbi:glutathione S-transferase [Aaosphaeria arxii CBS 175.79]|uniref:Glutathione S-transferase n=1 Tax=Aaosphaeria arxii CBS 175.79 TaxID=1450172 RepID=A0A6A5XAB4_9PLEO|nr:glutathione S-transferase [Aaosphaeria arxii CBS 175.79]KAF2009806.1 glutathione S-transferase [Aaosphaeria arxii CBS 175.79]